MPQSWMKLIKLLLVPAIFVLVMATTGCSADMSNSYPLESISTKDKGQTSRIYRAEDKTVPEVAQELADQKQPEEISKEDTEHMFLVYKDEIYHLQKDADKPSDTLIEVDSKEYVRQNYDSSFLQGYLVATIINDIFDGMKNNSKGSYRGYSSKDIYQPSTGSYHTPTEKEKKAAPPITKEGTGSITKRSATKKNTDGSAGAGGDIFKKQVEPSTGSTGKIIRNSDSSSSKSSSSVTPKRSSIFSSPKSNSPPRTKVGGSGRITKRR